VTSHPGQLSPAIPSWVGTTSQPKDDALRLGSKAGMIPVWVAGKTV